MKKRYLAAVIAAITCMALSAPLALAQKLPIVSPLAAYDLLKKDPAHTFLIDVRTRPEYQFTGHPPRAYNVPWRTWTGRFVIKAPAAKGAKPAKGVAPAGYRLSARPNARFVAVISSLFKKTDRLLVISAEDKRSVEAANALLKADFKKVMVVKDGLFGPPLGGGGQGKQAKLAKLAAKLSPRFSHPGRVAGWVFWGLPMTYLMAPKYVYPPDLEVQSLEGAPSRRTRQK